MEKNCNYLARSYSVLEIYKLALPSIISYSTVMLVSVINLSFIGYVNTTTLIMTMAVVANNVCAAIYYFLEGVRTGTAVLVASYFGANDSNKISQTINVAIFTAPIAGIIAASFTYLVSLLAHSVVKNGYSYSLGNKYFLLLLVGLPFHMIILATIGIYLGLKNSRFPLVITLVLCSLTAILSYFFIKVPMEISKINAIGFATVLAYIMSSIFGLILLTRTKITKKYIIPKISFMPILKKFWKIGEEIGLYAGFVIIGLFVFAFSFSPLGSAAVAAHQIVFQVYLATFLPSLGFFVVASIVVGKLIGEKKYELIPCITNKIWLSSLPVTLGVAGLCAIFAPKIANFFSPTNIEVAKMATYSLYLICASQFFGSIFLVYRGALTAAKDTRFLLISGSITTYLFFLPTSYLVGVKMGYGVPGGYFIFLIWSAVDATITLARFFSKSYLK